MNVLCNNKKSSFKYSFIKKIEAGLVLSGWEVKSLKDGNGQLSESYISIKKDEIYLCNAHIKTINLKKIQLQYKIPHVIENYYLIEKK